MSFQFASIRGFFLCPAPNVRRMSHFRNIEFGENLFHINT